MAKKRKKPDPEGRAYQKAERDTALSWCPEIYPCGKCGWPVIDGYCCRYCGDDNPQETQEEEAATLARRKRKSA